jgi:hypothetical protein
MRIVLAFVVIARVAAADPAPTVRASAVSSDAPPAHRFALAVNEPLGWFGAGALGLSAYGSIDAHQVIRLNVASWSRARTEGAEEAAAFLISGADGGAGADGRYTSASASWMYFPRRAYDGPSLELGALVQARHTHDYDDDLSTDATTITSTRVAGTAMIGWSWLGWDRVFASLQLGASYGREWGTHLRDLQDEMDVTTSLDRFGVEAEGMVRFGVLLN